MKYQVPVSPIALAIGVVVLLLGAFAPGRTDAGPREAPGESPGERAGTSSISVR